MNNAKLTWLRWAAFLPAAFVMALTADILVRMPVALILYYGFGYTDFWVAKTVGGVFGGGVFVFGASLLAPTRRRFPVVVAFFAMAVLGISTSALAFPPTYVFGPFSRALAILTGASAALYWSWSSRSTCSRQPMPVPHGSRRSDAEDAHSADLLKLAT